MVLYKDNKHKHTDQQTPDFCNLETEGKQEDRVWSNKEKKSPASV